MGSDLDCRVCSNGDLIFNVCQCCAAVVLCCEECMTCYRDPSLQYTFRGEQSGLDLRSATAEEIDSSIWSSSPDK